jgi:type IV pilus assembly protein PilE
MESIVTTSKSPIRSSGFTLIELMVVVAIVAIIAAIAIPTYQVQIRESRRTDAKTAVLDLAAREEKYFSLNNAYTGSPANLGYVAASNTSAVFPQSTGSGYYNLYACPSTSTGGLVTTTACTATGNTTGTAYVIAAIPITGTSQAKDSTCQYFAVDNTGTQFASSTQGIGTNTVSTCWH